MRFIVSILSVMSCLLGMILPASASSAANLPQSTLAQTNEACYPLINNSTFESVDEWRIANTPLPARYDAQSAYAGSYGMKLGIAPEAANRYSYSTFFQWVKIPNDGETIRMRAYIWRGSTGKSDSDFQYIMLGIPGSENRFLLKGRSNDQQWELMEYDLSAYKGKTISVLFGVYNNGGGGKTIMNVDEVWIMKCSPLP